MISCDNNNPAVCLPSNRQCDMEDSHHPDPVLKVASASDPCNPGLIDTGDLIEMREAVFLLRGDPVGELSLTPSNTIKETNDHPVVSLDSNANSTRPNGLVGKKQVAKRDERRRATHNEVERRRRDKINSWIMKLGSIIPDTCDSPSTRPGPVDGLSKGGILAAACEYINELKEGLTRHKLEVSTLCETSQFLMEENTRLQQENQQLNAGIQELKEILTRHGIPTETVKEEEPNVTLNNALSS